MKGVKQFFSLFLSSLKLCVKVNGARSNVITFLGVVVALFPVWMSVAFQYMSDEIQAVYTQNQSELNSVIMVLIFIMALKILEQMYRSIQKRDAANNAEKMKIHIRSEVLRSKCTIQYRYIEEHSEVFSKLSFINTYAIDRMVKNMQEAILWISYLVTFFSLIYALLMFQVAIVILLLLSCIPSAIISYKSSSSDFNFKSLHTDDLALTIEYYRDMCYPYSFNEIRMFGILGYIKEKLWKKKTVSYNQATQLLIKKYMGIQIISDLYRYSVLTIVLVLTAQEIYHSPLVGLGSFLLVFNIAGQLQEVTTTWFASVANFINDLQYNKSFFDLKDLPYEQDGLTDTVPNKADIKFENVSFRYKGSNEYALKDIHVTIRNGEKVAVVGANGSGKSTFINLLCAMYQPDNGVILVNGKDIQENVRDIRECISPVFQDFGKYEFSILENITLSDSNQKVDMDAIDEIAKLVGIDRFIALQKHGYQEVLGSFSEDGNNLSGGQWQKIAIARALYRDQAQIMILDEPTSALDPIAEAEIYRNFANLTKNKTTLLVSHRLGICSIVDRILVFDKGEIVEDGTHAELMKQNGVYRKLYLAQAKWYG